MQSTTSLLTNLLRSSFAPTIPTQAAWTLLRVVVGIMMIHNGMDKLADIEGFAEAYVQVIGLPFPIFFSYCAAFAELLGAPLLALGLLARPAAIALAGTMAVAMYHHVLVAGLSIPYLELSAIYFASFVFFAACGAGLFSLDAAIAGWLDARAGATQQQQLAALENSYEATEATANK